MPGALGSLSLLPPESPENIAESLSTSVTEAMKYLESQGLSPTAQPSDGYKGEMPNDLSSLDDDRLGDLLNRLSRWCGFLDAQVNVAGAQKKEAEEHLAKLRARIRLTFKADDEGRKLAGPDKDDLVDSDHRIVEATRREIYHYTIFSVLRGMRDEAQRNWESVSRRITQRGQEMNRMRRESNVAGVPLQGHSFRRRQQ